MATTSSAVSTAPALEPAALAVLDDHALMAAVQDGSAEAFATFYARHKPGVLSFTRHILGNREDAEDAVQHTFMAAYRHVQDEGPPAHPSAWLYTVARNRSLTMIRARRESPSDAVEPATAGLAEEVEWRFELRALLNDLARLPEEQRAALILFELGGLNQTEVGEVLESSPDKVKALVYQARHGLMDRAVARETECRVIRRRLSTLRGGRLNDRTLKHHLDECDGCRAFRADVILQRRGLAAILPVVPLVHHHEGILALLGIGGGAAAGAAAGAAHGAAASARPHRLAHATPGKVIAAGGVVAAASAALIFGLGGHAPLRVSDVTTSPPIAAAKAPPAHSVSPRAAHRAAAAHRAKPGVGASHPKASTSRRVVVGHNGVGPAAATPPGSSQPGTSQPGTTQPGSSQPVHAPGDSPPSSSPPATGTPTPKPPRHPTSVTPGAPAAPAPAAPTAPAASPPGSAPAPAPVVTTPPPVVTPPTPPPPGGGSGPGRGGKRNGPPGPIGNPQPHGPPPGWDPSHSPTP